MAELPTRFCYHNIMLYKSVSLGNGSYGGVFKAKCDGLQCAAKIIHPTLFDLDDPGAGSYLNKFMEECRLFSLARHPNVVQYLGTYTEPDTQLPVLLMELCDESLTSFLERSPGPLSYHIQVNICHDIALALVYLHSNGLIHRDLTGNNVLLVAGLRAKVTDFGMSKLATVNPRMSALTLCPGNVLYMAPEALDETTKSYTDKLDIFSFGVIVLQILTRQFPKPTDRFRKVRIPQVENEGDEEKEIREVIPETERRQAHLKLIPGTHVLKALILECLKKRDGLRPTALQLSEWLSDIKGTTHYSDSVLKSQSNSVIEQLEEQLKEQVIVTTAKTKEAEHHMMQITELESVITQKDRELQEKHDQILTCGCTIDAQKQQLQDYEYTILAHKKDLEAKDIQLQQLQHVVEGQGQQLHSKKEELHMLKLAHDVKDREIQDKDSDLQENQQKIERLQENLQVKEMNIQEKQFIIREQAQEIRELKDKVVQPLTEDSKDVTLEKKERNVETVREQLQASEQLVFEFQLSLEQKEEIISSLQQTISTHEQMIHRLQEQVRDSKPHPKPQQPAAATPKSLWRKSRLNAPEEMSRGAAVVHGDVAYFMPVGSHKVFSYHHKRQQWSQLPDNPNTDCGLVVIDGILTTVGGSRVGPTDILLSFMEDKEWAVMFPPMPTPRSQPGCVTLKRMLIVAGGDQGQDTASVGLDTVEAMDTHSYQWITISPLPRKCSSVSATVLGGNVYVAGGYCLRNSVFTHSASELEQKFKQTRSRLTRTRSQWKEIQKLPASFSSLVTMGSELVAVGGKDDSENPTANVHRYNFSAKVWKVFSQMENPRLFCLAVAFPQEATLMVVGGSDSPTAKQSVEFLNYAEHTAMTML